MKVVSILAQKGGVGKTTLALHLAVQAQKKGNHVAIIDTDPQGSASAWARRRASRQIGKPAVGQATERNLEQAVKACRKDGYSLVFIDTMPSVRSPTVAAAELADIVLVLCSPSPQDMDAVGSTAKLVKQSSKPAHLLLNRGRGSKMNEEVLRLLSEEFEIPACPITISHRAPMADAFLDGGSIVELPSSTTSVKNGKREISACWRWLEKQLEQRNGKK
ncbi:MAG: ParA family protein [Myxococcales bacterium FL481]|nr:MAG: ParA family protein [Myxococcales bacterium FL481]